MFSCVLSRVDIDQVSGQNGEHLVHDENGPKSPCTRFRLTVVVRTGVCEEPDEEDDDEDEVQENQDEDQVVGDDQALGHRVKCPDQQKDTDAQLECDQDDVSRDSQIRGDPNDADADQNYPHDGHRDNERSSKRGITLSGHRDWDRNRLMLVHRQTGGKRAPLLPIP